MRTDEITPTNDDDRLTFVAFAVTAASVMEWLRSEACGRDQNAEQSESGEQNSECGDDQRAHGSARVPDDDDCKDRREKAERENDSDAGRQVVATAPRLKPFACLSV